MQRSDRVLPTHITLLWFPVHRSNDQILTTHSSWPSTMVPALCHCTCVLPSACQCLPTTLVSSPLLNARCSALGPCTCCVQCFHGMEEVLFKCFLAQSVVFQESMWPSVVVFTPMALNRLSCDLLSSLCSTSSSPS